MHLGTEYKAAKWMLDQHGWTEFTLKNKRDLRNHQDSFAIILLNQNPQTYQWQLLRESIGNLSFAQQSM